MDSLKIPKGGSSSTAGGGAKPTGSVPITVRFNAGEECIDDIFQSFHNNSSSGVGGPGGGGGGGSNAGGGDSLSTSPSQHHQLQVQQNVDDVNARNNFLQGNFFNRKRSGSIEEASPTPSGPNAIAAVCSSDTTPVGTWKLFKGKVSQTLEDIKSSKSANQTLSASVTKVENSHPQQQLNDLESDNLKAHTSVNDDLSLDLERKSPHVKGGDSDSSLDSEQLLDGEVEQSKLRRGLANLKSKVKTKTTHHRQHQQVHSYPHQKSGIATAALSSATISTAFGTAAIKSMKKESSGSNISSASSLRGSLLRRRCTSPADEPDRTILVPRLVPQETPNIFPIQNDSETIEKGKKRGIIAGKKEVEIESGVEMTEDTLPTIPIGMAVNDDQPTTSTDKRFELLNMQHKPDVKDISTSKDISVVDETTPNTAADSVMPQQQHSIQLAQRRGNCARNMPIRRMAALFIILLLPVHSFIRGILACLMSFAIADSLSEISKSLLDKWFACHPERSEFAIPDYSNIPIFKVPAIEEYKTVKSYAGWMNEIFSYDPLTYHLSQVNPVYVKLDGTHLRVSSTIAHIPKRVIWNEVPINLENIQFTSHRSFDLLGCSVELLPLGLARKRYFNRKYPIQLIIKCLSEEKITIMNSVQDISHMNKADLISTESKFSRASSEVLSLYPENRDKGSAGEANIGENIINADLQQLPGAAEDISSLIPCGDETRLILFARADREKEDWYRRFVAASVGEVDDQMLHLPNLNLVDEADLKKAAAATRIIQYKEEHDANTGDSITDDASNALLPNDAPPLKVEGKKGKRDKSKSIPDDIELQAIGNKFTGLIMSSSAARNPEDYIRFMAIYQRACKESHIPVVISRSHIYDTKSNNTRRSKRHEADLWKGINRTLFLGPSGSVVWANVLIGRVLYSCLHDSRVRNKIKELLQKKFSAIKLPSFMEELIITDVDLGDTPPLIHRISQPMLDERGTWVDADITYEGRLQFTLTTKLNLMRMKQKRHTDSVNITVVNPLYDPTTSGTAAVDTDASLNTPVNLTTDEDARSDLSQITLQSQYAMIDLHETEHRSVIFDSDAESSGGSDSEIEDTYSSRMPLDESVESPTENASPQDDIAQPPPTDQNTRPSAPANARRIFKIVDRITASNFFQYATDLPYVQRAMENMSTNITLRIDVNGVVGRGVINIPPPPSDRLWLSFRGPPRLWLSAKPALGEKSMDYGIVKNIIENKLCEVVNKFLVYPNMVDVTIPFLGQPTYEYLHGQQQTE